MALMSTLNCPAGAGIVRISIGIRVWAEVGVRIDGVVGRVDGFPVVGLPVGEAGVNVVPFRSAVAQISDVHDETA